MDWAVKDGRVFLIGRLWKTDFPIEEVPKWLNFYRKMAARKNGRYAASYSKTVAALEAAEAQIKGEENGRSQADR